MSTHFTITVRVNEVTEAETDAYGKPVKPRNVEETSDVTIRATSKDEALRKLAIIIEAL